MPFELLQFWKIETCYFREIKICHFWEIKMCYFWEIAMSHIRKIEIYHLLEIKVLRFSGNWNVNLDFYILQLYLKLVYKPSLSLLKQLTKITKCFYHIKREVAHKVTHSVSISKMLHILGILTDHIAKFHLATIKSQVTDDYMILKNTKKKKNYVKIGSKCATFYV